jgi:hypothetical protein
LKAGLQDKLARWRCPPVRESAQTRSLILPKPSLTHARTGPTIALPVTNNDSSDAEMGKHMYPLAPDMRQAGTQNLTDGELFYIIQNVSA